MVFLLYNFCQILLKLRNACLHRKVSLDFCCFQNKRETTISNTQLYLLLMRRIHHKYTKNSALRIPSSHDRKFSGRKSFYFSLSHFIFRPVFYFPQIIQMRVSQQFFIHFYLSIKYAKKSNIFQLIGTQMCRKGREKLSCSSLCGTKVSFFFFNYL